MPHYQVVEQVPGQQLWVETWSWCDSRSPCAPLIYTSLGGQVNIWKVKPKERKRMPMALKVLCAIPGVYFLWGAITSANKMLMERHRHRAEIVVRVRNSYCDSAGREVVPRTNVRSSANPYTQEEWSIGLFYPRYPHLEKYSTPVFSIQTDAEIYIGGHTFHHTTWDGLVGRSAETGEAY